MLKSLDAKTIFASIRIVASMIKPFLTLCIYFFNVYITIGFPVIKQGPTFNTLSSSLVISRPLMNTSVFPLLAWGLSFPVKFKFELIILSGFLPSCKINKPNCINTFFFTLHGNINNKYKSSTIRVKLQNPPRDRAKLQITPIIFQNHKYPLRLLFT